MTTKEIVYIGASPTEVDCAQTTQPDFMQRARLELNLYKQQLEEMYPAPEGAYFAIKWQSHDFGSYGEVVAVFDPSNQDHEIWAFKSEDGCPHWSESSLKELQAYESKRQAQLKNKH